MKLKLYIEYDGTNYSGWQKQINAKTVQGTLIKAIESVFKRSKGENKYIDFQGSGRTDSGVHALEQIAHLECKTMLAPYILKYKLNDELPSDINVLKIEKANENFHARYSAVSRQYLYRISKRRTAFEKKYVWWVKDKLNTELMKEASLLFLGLHDFSSFCEPDKENKSTKIYLEKFEITEDEEMILLRLKASRFLWKMVRRITGTVVESGREKLTQEDIKNFFRAYSDIPAKLTAPPSGLFLEKVLYE